MNFSYTTLGRDAGENSLQEFGLPFNNLNILNEHGLIISDYGSRRDMRMCIGIPAPISEERLSMIRLPFGFQERNWVLTPSSERTTGAEYRISGVALTQAGKELSKIIECKEMPEYHKALADFFASQNLIMTEVNGPEAHIIYPGTGYGIATQ